MNSSSTERGPTHDQPLAGRRYLVVEDDYLVAATVADLLALQGATVAGPVASVDDAGKWVAESSDLDGAVVDINVAGTVSYGLVEELEQRGVPSIFLTGYKTSGIPARFAHVPCIEKPTGSAAIVQALLGLPPKGAAPGV